MGDYTPAKVRAEDQTWTRKESATDPPSSTEPSTVTLYEYRAPEGRADRNAPLAISSAEGASWQGEFLLLVRCRMESAGTLWFAMDKVETRVEVDAGLFVGRVCLPLAKPLGRDRLQIRLEGSKGKGLRRWPGRAKARNVYEEEWALAAVREIPREEFSARLEGDGPEPPAEEAPAAGARSPSGLNPVHSLLGEWRARQAEAAPEETPSPFAAFMPQPSTFPTERAEPQAGPAETDPPASPPPATTEVIAPEPEPELVPELQPESESDPAPEPEPEPEPEPQEIVADQQDPVATRRVSPEVETESPHTPEAPVPEPEEERPITVSEVAAEKGPPPVVATSSAHPSTPQEVESEPREQVAGREELTPSQKQPKPAPRHERPSEPQVPPPPVPAAPTARQETPLPLPVALPDPVPGPSEIKSAALRASLEALSERLEAVQSEQIESWSGTRPRLVENLQTAFHEALAELEERTVARDEQIRESLVAIRAEIEEIRAKIDEQP